MQEISSKQRRRLRSLGRGLKAAVIAGKGSLSDQLVGQVAGQLALRELVKVRLLQSAGCDRRAAGEELALKCDATCVAVVGWTVLLYRPNEQLDQSKRIVFDA